MDHGMPWFQQQQRRLLVKRARRVTPPREDENDEPRWLKCVFKFQDLMWLWTTIRIWRISIVVTSCRAYMIKPFTITLRCNNNLYSYSASISWLITVKTIQLGLLRCQASTHFSFSLKIKTTYNEATIFLVVLTDECSIHMMFKHSTNMTSHVLFDHDMRLRFTAHYSPFWATTILERLVFSRIIWAKSI